MNRKFLDQAAFREAARAGRGAAAPVEHAATLQRVATDGSRTMRWVLSDGSVDRMGDTIDPTGWALDAYKRNPVVLFSHLADEPPIARMQGPWVSGSQLVGDIEFPPAETYAFADDIFKLVQDGFIRAGSVGFLPLRYQFSTDKSRLGGIDFLEQELLEFSITPVPANANALIQARAKGMSTGPLWGRSGDASPQIAARLRSWARETTQPEEELAAKVKRLRRQHLRDAADTSTPEGRAHYARRLRAFYAAAGGRLVDRRAAEAEAAFRTAPRW